LLLFGFRRSATALKYRSRKITKLTDEFVMVFGKLGKGKVAMQFRSIAADGIVWRRAGVRENNRAGAI